MRYYSESFQYPAQGKGSMFGFLRAYFSDDLAIDLGTANTCVYARDFELYNEHS